MFILSHTKEINSDKELSDDILEMVDDAKVSVRGSDGSVFIADGYYGIYLCNVGDLNPDVEYYLHIEYDGDILVTPDTPFDPNKENYYSWTCDETWEVHSDYTTTVYYDLFQGKGIFKMHQFPERGWKDATRNTVMVGSSTNYEGQHIQKLKIYDIDHSDERVFYRYSGLVHQRAISKAEYEYVLAQQQASSDMGGLFTPQPSAPLTNIRCLTSSKHVIGFVGCSLNTGRMKDYLAVN